MAREGRGLAHATDGRHVARRDEPLFLLLLGDTADEMIFVRFAVPIYPEIGGPPILVADLKHHRSDSRRLGGPHHLVSSSNKKKRASSLTLPSSNRTPL